MTWQIVYDDEARRRLRSLDPPVAQRVIRAIERFAGVSAGDVKHLRGTEGELRLRVGDWRVRFILHTETGIMEILTIDHRREAYRRR